MSEVKYKEIIIKSSFAINLTIFLAKFELIGEQIAWIFSWVMET